jgi:replicative DNA helicase
MSHLRDSGKIEEDADIVCLMYRESYYNPSSENKGGTELIVAKNRNGATGTVLLYFKAAMTQFVSAAVERR